MMNQLLLQARIQTGLTQLQVADLVGATVLTVWRWEHGTLPNPFFRQRLCALFQKKEAELGFLHPDGESVSRTLPTPAHIDPALPPLSHPLLGRKSLEAALKADLLHMRGMISLVGLPGIGKTALVQALAADPEVHQAFPDGVVWMNLGQNPQLNQHLSRWVTFLQEHSEPLQPLHAKRELTSHQSWNQRLRAMIGTRRMLLIFDDVWSMDDLLACQVAGPQCVSLVTTRFPRIACCAAHVYRVGELSEDDGLALVEHYAPHLLVQQPEAVRRLVRAVGGHPLALVLIGLALRIESHTGQLRRVRASLDRLMQASERLRLAFPNASTITPALSLSSTISTSAQILNAETRDALRKIARYAPLAPFQEEDVIRTTCISPQTLDQLSDAGLLESTESGAYRLHPIIADYARMAS